MRDSPRDVNRNCPRRAIVGERESFSRLCARLGVPGCMLLRANRVFSPAWFLPGREIDVPEGAFCLTDTFCCPALAMLRRVEGKRAFDADDAIVARAD